MPSKMELEETNERLRYRLAVLERAARRRRRRSGSRSLRKRSRRRPRRYGGGRSQRGRKAARLIITKAVKRERSNHLATIYFWKSWAEELRASYGAACRTIRELVDERQMMVETLKAKLE